MSKYPTLTPKSELGFKALNFGRTATGKTASITTLLLAGQKVRFLSADNNALAGINAGLSLYKIDKEDVDFSVCVPERPALSMESMLDVIDMMLKTEIDVIIKSKDKHRKENTGFRNICEGASSFTDVLTKESKGKVNEWGTDTTFVVDSLTVVCDEIRAAVCGTKPPTQPEWGQMQNFVKFFVSHITGGLKCNVVLLAHPIKETDPISGSTTLYPLNLGQALNESFASNFSDVMYSQFDGKEYFWSTKHRTAVCSGRNLPIAEKLSQDYRQFFLPEVKLKT
jgi:hypothetical protein